MKSLKKITKKVLEKTGIIPAKKEINKKDAILALPDVKLLSTIGMEAHSFYYPENNGKKDSAYLENLIKEAERRNLSNSGNVRGAKILLEEIKLKKNNPISESIFADYKSSEYFFELARKRRSIRKFSDKKISKDVVYKILNCAIEAPSSCNRQTWRFLICNDKKYLSFISKIRRVPFLKYAPVAICVMADKELYIKDKELEYTLYLDGAAAIMNIIYAAESLGLASCWVNFGESEISQTDREEFYKVFKINSNFQPISLVALGYAAQNINKPKRELIDYYILNS